MMHSRFTDTMVESADALVPQPASAFMLLSAAPAETGQATSMQWLYQRLYEEATKASKPAPTRDLFSVMN